MPYIASEHYVIESIITNITMLKRVLISTLLLLTVTLSFGQTTLKLKKDDGIYLVPCKINGLDFDLYFDTGASLVSFL